MEEIIKKSNEWEEEIFYLTNNSELAKNIVMMVLEDIKECKLK